MMEHRKTQLKKWSNDPNSAKYHSRSASYKAENKKGKNSKENWSV